MPIFLAFFTFNFETFFAWRLIEQTVNEKIEALMKIEQDQYLEENTYY